MSDNDPRFLGFLAVDSEKLCLLSFSHLLGLLLDETQIRSVLILQPGADGVYFWLSLLSQLFYFHAQLLAFFGDKRDVSIIGRVWVKKTPLFLNVESPLALHFDPLYLQCVHYFQLLSFLNHLHLEFLKQSRLFEFLHIKSLIFFRLYDCLLFLQKYVLHLTFKLDLGLLGHMLSCFSQLILQYCFISGLLALSFFN